MSVVFDRPTRSPIIVSITETDNRGNGMLHIKKRDGQSLIIWLGSSVLGFAKVSLEFRREHTSWALFHSLCSGVADDSKDFYQKEYSIGLYFDPATGEIVPAKKLSFDTDIQMQILETDFSDICLGVDFFGTKSPEARVETSKLTVRQDSLPRTYNVLQKIYSGLM